ncbi:hypothetical protein [Brevibacillus dissolubilis]|uniref:hypothetical protein n=1 Tax=Brevibacillus dissolubilis TaxID=1844116 RepID=UPI001116C22E|nr:hypothetical protein [Brevibacillus dissolubilis]
MTTKSEVYLVLGASHTQASHYLPDGKQALVVLSYHQFIAMLRMYEPDRLVVFSELSGDRRGSGSMRLWKY